MDIDYTNNAIITMQHHLDAANKYLTELAKGYRSVEKQNTLLDAAMKQVELCCIDMRNLCEKERPTIIIANTRTYNRKEIYGEVTQLDNGWLDIRLNALLPHCTMIGGTQYVFDTVRILSVPDYRQRLAKNILGIDYLPPTSTQSDGRSKTENFIIGIKKRLPLMLMLFACIRHSISSITEST